MQAGWQILQQQWCGGKLELLLENWSQEEIQLELQKAWKMALHPPADGVVILQALGIWLLENQMPSLWCRPTITDGPVCQYTVRLQKVTGLLVPH
jgi:hypothetical protein